MHHHLAAGTLAMLLLGPPAHAGDDASYDGYWEACQVVDDAAACDAEGTEGRRWYRDADQDGLGDRACALRAHEPPCGYVRNGDDPDDTHSDL